MNRALQTLAALDDAVRIEIDALRAAGISFNAIAAALNRRGIPGLQGGRWYGATVQRALRPGAQPVPQY